MRCLLAYSPLAVAVVVAGLMQPGLARADSLDKELLKAAPVILADAKTHGYKSIGVLPFQVDKGKGPRYDNAPLCREMPLRLENALIMLLDTSKPILVLRDVAQTARAAKKDPTGSRAALFNLSYPVAWGGKAVRPDALLTGVIRCTGNREKTEVVIQVYDAKNPNRAVQLTRFSVNTDRTLLGELGYSYTINRQSLVSARSASQRDAIARNLVRRRDSGDLQSRVDPSDVGGISFELLYNGVVQQLQSLPGTQRGNEYVAPPIPAGTQVTMRVGPNGQRQQETLAVLVKVNGESTFERQTGDALNCQKWIYRPGTQPDLYEGYYFTDGAAPNSTSARQMRLNKFKVTDDPVAVSKVAGMGPDAGWITLQVFVSDPKGGGDPLMVSTRALSKQQIAKRGLNTPAKIQQALLAANHVRLVKSTKPRKTMVNVRGVDTVIEPENEAVPGPTVKETGFPNATCIGELRIRYADFGSGTLTISTP